jgi:hypothetical protein
MDVFVPKSKNGNAPAQLGPFEAATLPRWRKEVYIFTSNQVLSTGDTGISYKNCGSVHENPIQRNSKYDHQTEPPILSSGYRELLPWW